MFRRITFYFLLSFTILISSCEKDTILPANSPDHPPVSYLHISHTRTDSNPYMDSIVERVDYKKIDMLWLGGDLTAHTSADDETLQHIDSIFNIGNENTLWSLGNHDYPYLNRIQEFTNRLAYYTYFKNGITFIILDTQDSLSSIVGAQKDFFNAVVDTIQESSHLIILHHKLIWMYNNPDLEPQISSIANGGYGDCFYCTNPNNFYEVIYPKLVDVKQRNINVICIAGDIGKKVKEFQYTTDEDILFLASGIDFKSTNNKALLFEHDIANKVLEWKYIQMEDL